MNIQNTAWYLIGLTALLSACSSNNDPYQNINFPQSYTQSGGYNSSPQLISSEQLQSLLSPIALYPDSLLSLMLLASTYPLEVAEAYNWRTSNSSLNGAALQDALKAQSWNDSVKSLISFPQAFNMMGSKLQWTQNLGNAYKLQAADTMKAVQILRKRAVQAGTLKSNQQIENPTEIIANQIEIEIHKEEELQQCTDADMIIFKEFGIVSDHTFQELRTINPVAAPSLYKAKKARKNIDEMFKINIKKNGINELYILNIITEIANRKL
jgi:hypothetical protein